MPQVIAIDQGAGGTVKAVTDEGSLFVFKPRFLALDAQGLYQDSPRYAEPMLHPPIELSLEALELAASATAAEAAALSLLARAEQYRLGLSRKLAARGFDRKAVQLALDSLGESGLLCDQRYASAWVRQRLRRHIEGPRSLASALSAKGVATEAVERALRQALGEASEEGRHELVMSQVKRLHSEGLPIKDARARLISLGWKRLEIDEAFDALEIS